MNAHTKGALDRAADIERELLTKAQAAHLLGVSVRTVDNLMRQRRISFVKLTPKTVRFPRREILAQIRDHYTIHAHGCQERQTAEREGRR